MFTYLVSQSLKIQQEASSIDSFAKSVSKKELTEALGNAQVADTLYIEL